jgi:class 3 adenylate cyclase/uncharacterized protein (DUF427 family)
MKPYEIRLHAHPRRVRVEFNGTWIADSRRALVLHETRHAPVFYFPPQDVRFDLMQKTALRTHCPFKGDASYWTLAVGDKSAENAVWSYEDAIDDAEGIRGYAAFYPDRVSAIYDGDDEVNHAPSAPAAHEVDLGSWVLTQGAKAETPEALMEGFCRALQRSGIPVARMTVIMPTLHPQIFATVLVWRDDGGVRTIYEPHDILHQPKFKDSPFKPILDGAVGVRRRLERPECPLDFPVVRDLKGEGATDYVAMPFRFSDAQLNVMSMTSFMPGGFTTAHLGAVYEVLRALAAQFEVHAQRRTAVALLKTYLGAHTGDRVLAGQVKHGDGERIHSVVWFSDLRESTALSKSMPVDEYLRYLNRYLGCVASAILENGGEVLRFIGDAALAIFPIAGTGEVKACRQAIAAAQLAGERIAAVNREHPQTPIRYGIGLHLGDVTYGNIGVPERLEFTVIGAAANEAARVESMCKTLGRPLVISAAFADAYPGKLASLGKHALKDVQGEQELFTLP